MTGTGFYEQKKFSPAGLGTVVALHAAALGALALTKPTVFERVPVVRTIAIQIPEDETPPPVPPPPQPVERREQLSQLDRPVPIINPPSQGPVVTNPPAPPPPLPPMIGAETTGTAGTASPVLPPLRIDAEFDPRFADAMQPPYPTSEQRAQRDGSVRLRVTIGADGRVKAVERLAATSDAFWNATERHARSRWRFRPATVDGRPVESRKVLSVHFRIEA